TYALTLDGKSALFASALEAAAQVRADPAIAALADPQLVPELLRCAPALRFAQLALRELSREPAGALPALDEALADANASALPDRHGSQVAPRWRTEAGARLADVPRRVAVLPPRLEPVLDSGGKVVDAQATAVQDLDEQILRDWAAY